MSGDRSQTKKDSRWRCFDATEKYDVIIVGAGIGGLTAGGLLAKRGKKVLVLDKHSVPGGNATVFNRRDYQFEVGVHYLGGCGEHGPIRAMLEACGVSDVEFEEMDPQGFDVFRFPDFEFRMPKGLEQYRERLLEAFPEERKGIERYCKLARQLSRVFRSRGSLPKAAGASLLAPMVGRWMNKTLEEFLDSCTQNEQLRAVLVGQSGDYGLPASRSSVILNVACALYYLGGAYVPKGGGQVMADALADAIEDAGGKVLLMAPVDRIVVEDGRVRGVEFENKHVGRHRVDAATVISNADLKNTVLHLVGEEHVSKRTAKRVKEYEMAPALGTVYLGLKTDVGALGLSKSNYWIYPTYDSEVAYREALEGRFSEQPPCYVSLASLKDPTNRHLAPAGKSNVQLITVAPSQPEAWGVTEEEFADGSYRRNPRYREAKERFAERLLRTAVDVLPDIANQIDYLEVASPLTQSRYTGSTGGTSYGIAGTPDQFMMNRAPTKTEIPGLFLCGASCRAGHGVQNAMISGVMAAGSAVQRNLLKEVLHAPEEVENKQDGNWLQSLVPSLLLR